MAPFRLESERAHLLTEKLGYKIAIQNRKLKKKKNPKWSKMSPDDTVSTLVSCSSHKEEVLHSAVPTQAAC